MWPRASCWVGSLRWHIGLRAWPLTRTTHHIGRGSLVHCGTSPPLGTQPNCHGLQWVVPENLISNQNQCEFLFLTPSAPKESKCCTCYTYHVSKYYSLPPTYRLQLHNDCFMLYAFFWVIPQCLNFICQCFGTHCLFHLQRWIGMKND